MLKKKKIIIIIIIIIQIQQSEIYHLIRYVYANTYYVESSSLAISGTITLEKRVLTDTEKYAKAYFVSFHNFWESYQTLSQSQRETRGPSFQLPFQIAKGQLLFGPLQIFL